MRNGFLASLPGLLVGAGLVLGQPAQGPAPTSPPAEGESKQKPPDQAGSSSVPLLGVLDGLACHFDGTCGRTKGDVFFAEVDYLFWVLRNANVPVALASTGPAAQGPFAAGALGNTGTEVLIGDHDLAYHHRPSSGLRVSLAYWQEDPLPEMDWDRPRTFAVEANFLFLGERGIAMRNDTASVVGRPFFDLNSRSEVVFPVAFPPVVAGGPALVTGGVTATANYGLWGSELNLWKNIYYEYPGRTVRLDFLAGFRYLDLGEDLSVTSQQFFSQQLAAGAFSGNQLLINDLFNTRDQFYGAQIGAVAKFFLEVLDLTLTTKIGFGDNAEQVHTDGYQVRTMPGRAPVLSRGGLLVLPSNLGRFRQDEFSVVPEFDAMASYVICRHVTLTAGYQFIYWSRVVRPGDQIDRAIDVTQIPNFPAGGAVPTGVARPTIPFRQTDFWAQGLTVGVQLVW
jgi:hypothetical protein